MNRHDDESAILHHFRDDKWRDGVPGVTHGGQKYQQIRSDSCPFRVGQLTSDLRGHDLGEIGLLRIAGAAKNLPLVPALDRGGIRDPRQIVEDRQEIVRVLGDVAGDLRTRPHQAHLTPEDLAQLRQLVEFETANPAPDPGHPLVPGDRES